MYILLLFCGKNQILCNIITNRLLTKSEIIENLYVRLLINIEYTIYTKIKSELNLTYNNTRGSWVHHMFSFSSYQKFGYKY